MVLDIPEAFLRDLNGGIVVVEEAKPDPEIDGVYILGEYIEDPFGLGRLIVIYHGSFAALYSREPETVWKEELRATLLHEIQHHLEALAGVDDLDREDARILAEFKNWARQERGK
ncbi:MAG: metallopeptidase family protein [Firmicutes bacterium]|nr:metallopeptidase family protein [Bacillota bacterium]